MKEIQLTARGVIHKGKVEELKSVAAQCMRGVREREPGTTQYDWFLNESQMECVIRETYADSNAMLAHLGNLGPLLGALLGTGDWSLEVCGNPSEELLKAIAGVKATVYTPFQSK